MVPSSQGELSVLGIVNDNRVTHLMPTLSENTRSVLHVGMAGETVYVPIINDQYVSK